MEKSEEINFGKPTLTASVSAKEAIIKELESSLGEMMFGKDIPIPTLDEESELLESAWGLIANAGGGNWDLETERWRVAAKTWRDRYHLMIAHVWIRETIDKEE